MAWNDVFVDDRAVHLLITIGGHRYNFSNGTDIKVERKIGDTLSKFSLGIIDDGSDSYIEFERVVLNRFVNIEIEYGNSSKSTCKYTGFVVDYQPVFFGPSTKLTVTGYLTRKQAGLPDQTSPYMYYIDWAPLVGKRIDTEKDWDDIYNGNFSFDHDSYENALKDESIVDENTVNAKINELQDQIDQSNNFEKERGIITSSFYNKLKNNSILFNKLFAGQSGGDGKPYTQADITSVQMYETGEIFVCFKGGNANNVYTDNYGIAYDENDPSSFSQLSNNDLNSVADLLGDALIRLNNYRRTYDSNDSAISDVYVSLKKLASLDTYGNAADTYFQVGHVPWNYDLISKYKGNVVFSKFTHPKDSRRSIARVVPDLFIEWDKDIPTSSEYVDEEGNAKSVDKGGSGDLKVFPDWAVNDIKIFGLMYEFNQNTYINNPGSPYDAYALDEFDTHGVRRIYRAKDKCYIWVGDIPELYKKWKESKWTYNSKYYMKHKKIYTNDTPNYTYYEKGTEYKIVGQYIKYNKGNSSKHNWFTGKIEKAFKASGDWDEDVIAGNIREIQKGGKNINNMDILNYGEGYREYKIAATETDKPLKGMKPMSTEDRVTQYLQATYRSAFPISYGVIYISDIVAQLCRLEGWNNPYIVATTATSYKADYLNMNGMSALEYISQKLCPNAMEAGGTGRVGFECHFDKSGRFHFEPVDIKRYNVTLRLGYNINNSPVISFTVRSRGQLLMLGIDESVEEISSITGETISVNTKRSGTLMSETEARLNQAAIESKAYSPITNSDGKVVGISASGTPQFFNLSLFNYYGYESNLNAYKQFLSKISTEGSINQNMPYGTSLIRRSYNSSGSSSTSAALAAYQDLEHLGNTCIKAELTMIGDNIITPGTYIHLENYTRRGKHYTSGDYYVQNITDSVTAANGFTQTLSLWRYSDSVYSMKNSPSNTTINSGVVQSKFEEGYNIYKNQGQQAYEEWFKKNFPNEAE